MKHLTSPYRKTLWHFLCLLLGLSTDLKKTYALARPFCRMPKTFSKKYYAPSYKHIYRRYALPISTGRPVSANKQWSLAGYYRGGYNYSKVRWIYSTYAPFASQSTQASATAYVRQPREAANAIPPQQLNFTLAPEKTEYFVGCQQEIARLAPYFDSTGELVVFPPITGVGGAGKTQLVLELIQQYAANYDHIVWINAATTQDIENSYGQIAAHWGVDSALSKDLDEAVPLVHQKLQDKHVLYVFDNAPDLKTIQPYWQNGHILITSRNSKATDWRLSLPDAPLTLKPLSLEDTLQLAKKMGQNTNDPNFRELAQLLPKQPLVVVQLLSFMREHLYTPHMLLGGIKERNTKVVAQLKTNLQAHTTSPNLLSEAVNDMIEAFQNLETACFYSNQGDYKNAITFWEKTLGLFIQVHGNTPHPKIADACYFLGTLHCLQGLYDKAIAFLKIFLDMYKKLYGDTPSKEVVSAYKYIAMSYQHKGDLKNANKFYRERKVLNEKYKWIKINKQKYVPTETSSPHVAT